MAAQITQTIGLLPPAPNPALDTPTEFGLKAAASVAAQQLLPPELNAFGAQANALSIEVNARATEAVNYRDGANTAWAGAVSARDLANTAWTGAVAARDVAVNAAAIAGNTVAFSDNLPLIKGTADPGRFAYFYLGYWAVNGTVRQYVLPDKDGVVALTSDVDRRPDTYITSSTSAAINFTNGSYVGFAPTPGSTATVTIAGLGSTPIGQPGSVRIAVLEGYRMGAANLTWGTTINWIKPDGSSTTNINQAGFTLRPDGIDFIVLFVRANSGDIFGMCLR